MFVQAAYKRERQNNVLAPYGDPTPAFDVTIFYALPDNILLLLYHVHSTGWYASNKDDIEGVGPFGNGFIRAIWPICGGDKRRNKCVQAGY